MCIIDSNPLPLVQEKILNLLYLENKFTTRFVLTNSPEHDNVMVEMKHAAFDNKKEVSIVEFFERASLENKIFLLEQLTLEADL